MSGAPTLSLQAVADAEPVMVRVSEVLRGLTHALDVTEGHPRGHAARSCLIGMRLASLLSVDEREQADLFYALLLKDAGCSSNAARVHQLFGGDDQSSKRALWLRDWRRFSQKAAYALETVGRGESVWMRLRRLSRLAHRGPELEREVFQVRCDRGASIARGLGLSEETATAIRTMDEHWDGGGQPAGLRGESIPLAGRIIGLAQVFEIFAHQHGPAAALDVIRARSRRWFAPELVDAAKALAADASFWQRLDEGDEADLVAAAKPLPAAIVADATRLDLVAEALTRLRRAALLHDIGKLGVPNSILDKKGRLTEAEWVIVRRHPELSWTILNAVPVFAEFAFDASCHHEKLDGSGYHAGRHAPELTVPARLLAVADMCDALLADRPYRAGMTPERAQRTLLEEMDAGKPCPDSVAAACDLLASLPESHAEVGPSAAA